MTKKMKDSGIDWIGQIPEDWEVVKNKYLFKSKKNVVGNEFKAFNLLSLTKRKGIIYRDIENMEGKLPESFTTYQSVEKDDLVLCLFDLDISAVFSDVSKFDGMISSAYNNFEIKNDYPMFYKYWFDMINDGRKYKIYSKSLRYTIDIDNFNSLLSVKPPISKQKSIADFLDEKTQEIDNIISKTKKAIEEYKKYKQSLITEAVTKGLDKNVEMKDSGIEWIGEIPEDWDSVSLNRVLKLSITDGPHETPEYVDDGIPFISVDSLGFGEKANLDIVKKYITEEDYEIFNKKTNLETGDILFTKAATIGKLAIKDERKFMVWSPIAVIKPNDQMIESEFLYNVFSSNKYISHVTLLGTSNTQINVGMGTLEKSKIPLPPIEKQKSIADFLDEKTNQIDQIISTKEKLLTEMEAYKKSLIYETVTGKREVK